MFLISKKVRESLLVLLLVGSVIVSLLIGHSAPVVAQQVSPAGNAKPSIVLVHGAFVDGTSWQHVIPLLEQDGYTVTAVQIPLTSLAEDIAVTKRVIEAQEGAVVVAGHSYGGNVMTGAAAGNSQVKGLVYINAFAPDAGETTSDLNSKYAAPPISTAIVSDTANFLYVDREKFHAFLPETCRTLKRELWQLPKSRLPAQRLAKL